jgi:carbonic anhydrase
MKNSHCFKTLTILALSLTSFMNIASETGHKTHQEAAKPAAHGNEHHKREAGPIDASTALRYLRNGNKRFTEHKLRNDGISARDLERLSTGQKPHAIVLSCSDSRVPPEILFDQKLGEIFVVRTAGQSLDSSAVASIEYHT